MSPLLTVVNSVVAWLGTGGSSRNNYAIRYGKVVTLSYNVYNINLPAQGAYFKVSSDLAPTATRYVSGFFVNSSGSTLVPCVYTVATDGTITVNYSSSVNATQFTISGAYIV